MHQDSSGALRSGALGACALAMAAGAAAAAARGNDLPAHAPGEVIVQWRKGSDALDRSSALARAGLAVRKVLTPRSARDAGDPPLVRAAGHAPVDEILARLEGEAAVEYAEPNFACRPEATATDPYYTSGSLWGTYSDDSPTVVGPSSTRNEFGSQAEEAWARDLVGSRSVLVAVIDEGMDISHPELATNVWTNPHDPVDGRDNDGNGYVDDLHGWDFLNDDRSVYDGGTLDRHGTHCAGTIGARANNGLGITGVCWNVGIIPAKFMGASGGYVSDAIAAMDYVTDLKRRHGLRIVATSNSWSSSGYSQSLHAAVLRAAKQGIISACAAANDGSDNDVQPKYPASLSTLTATATEPAATYEAVLSVAAIDRYGALAGFSNYGRTSVDLGAPGVGITSCLPGNTYGTWSGTSMATPHVAGALALLAAANPALLAPELRSRILSSARATLSLSGKTATGGRLDVSAALGSTPPSAIRDVAVVSITAPAHVSQGYVPTVAVTVANQGNQAESFTVSLADAPPAGGRAGTPSAPQVVSVAAGGTRAVYFQWATTGATSGVHVLTGRASAVSGETDLADNTRTASSRVMTPADGPLLFGISPNATKAGTSIRVVVTGANMLAGVRLTFQNGEGGTPAASNVVRAADGLSLTATVTVASGGPARNRLWDVVVTNPDGRSARLVRGLVVSP